jgi:mRNA-degrading endonuclease RelE of RelBE toxin-antitoxin system
MKFTFTERGFRDYQSLPAKLQTRVDKQLAFLLRNLRHPSLRAKKYGEANDIWQARINKDYRFYFCIEDDIYKIISIIPHPK